MNDQALKIAADHLAETVRDYLEEMEHLADPCLRKALDEYNAIARASSPSTPAVAEASKPIIHMGRTVTTAWCGATERVTTDWKLATCSECERIMKSPANTSPASECRLSPCVICGKPCCTREECNLPGHDTTCELSDGKGWVCSRTCWETFADRLDAPESVPSATVAPASTAAEIPALHSAAMALNMLLSDPEPGLLTWREAVGRKIAEIAAFNTPAPAPATSQDGMREKYLRRVSIWIANAQHHESCAAMRGEACTCDRYDLLADTLKLLDSIPAATATAKDGGVE